jgi:hypothetical protein
MIVEYRKKFKPDCRAKKTIFACLKSLAEKNAPRFFSVISVDSKLQ